MGFKKNMVSYFFLLITSAATPTIAIIPTPAAIEKYSTFSGTLVGVGVEVLVE
jgi:hypothetical protein